jgi:hypothetical protein
MNLMANIRRGLKVRRKDKSRRGVAAVEFALTLPIWITLLLGAGDGTYCMLVNERADRIAYSITDIVTQYQTITQANLADISQAAGQLMQPLPFDQNGILIVTSVYQAPGQRPTICWQYTSTTRPTGGSNPPLPISKVGTANGNANCAQGTLATLPNGLILNDNDNVVISEVYYTFTPMFLSTGLFPGGDIYRVAVYKPRLSPLITIPS